MNSEEIQAALARVLFDRAPCFVAMVDRQHCVVGANSAFAASFTLAPRISCHQALKGQDQPCASCPVDQAFADGCEHVADEDGLNRDRKTMRLRLQAVPVASPHGAVEQVALIGTDVTRLGELEAGLTQAERLAMAGLNAAALAHTIKNILGGLDGGLYMVDTGIAGNDSGRLTIGWEMVKTYIGQVKSLVQNLLRFARPGAPERTEVEPAALVADVLRLYQSKAAMASIEIETDVASAVPSVLADREALHAALANLVANAIDACTWDPATEKEHRIVVAARPRSAGGVIFEVRDNGMGISAENQPRVLRVLFTSKGTRGTGLGLLLTKKTAVEHGGSIEFESTPGQGTTFRLEIGRGEP